MNMDSCVGNNKLANV